MSLFDPRSPKPVVVTRVKTPTTPTYRGTRKIRASGTPSPDNPTDHNTPSNPDYWDSSGYGSPSSASQSSKPYISPEDLEEMEQLRKDRLDAALEEISAEYGVSEAELQSRLSGIAAEYSSMMENVDAFARQDKQRVTDDAIRRGIGRSGIFAGNMAESLAAIAKERATIEGTYKTPDMTQGPIDLTAMQAGDVGTKAYGIAQQMIALQAAEDAARKKAELESAQEEFDFDAWLASLLV